LKVLCENKILPDTPISETLDILIGGSERTLKSYKHDYSNTRLKFISYEKDLPEIPIELNSKKIVFNTENDYIEYLKSLIT